MPRKRLRVNGSRRAAGTKKWILLTAVILLSVLLFIQVLSYYSSRGGLNVSGFRENPANSKFYNLIEKNNLLHENFGSFSGSTITRLDRIYIPEASDEIYYFSKKEIAVLDRAYRLKRVKVVDEFNRETNQYFGDIISSSRNKIWLNIEVSYEDKGGGYGLSGRIAEMSVGNEALELRFYDVGNYSFAVLNDAQGILYLFRGKEGYDEVFYPNVSQCKCISKHTVKGLEGYYVMDASFNPDNGMMLVCGSDASESILGLFRIIC